MIVKLEAKHKRRSRAPSLRIMARLNFKDMRNSIAGIRLSLTVSLANLTSCVNSQRPSVYKVIDPNMTKTIDGNHWKKASLKRFSSATNMPHNPNITAIKSNP